MPQIAPIGIADAAATPVTHTFAPVTTDGQRATLANRAASIPSGYEVLQLEFRPPSSASAPYRLIGKLKMPTVAAVLGLDEVVDLQTVNFDINFSQKSSGQTRKNVVKLLSGLFAHATVVTMVENTEPLY